MKKLGKNVEIEVFPKVGHAFANPTGNNYNAAAAEAAWIRTLSFLRLHLAIGSNE
jgi:carboxymethylenebutenolidase